ncbi:hypothetical protein [Yinghuangia sp. YIM S09857]|uniref:hypothetical protein n=1 Tax=Yinghuangia sp. YIM S09857 TaxID=3436929 RepID=UPI003F52C56D
MKGQRGQALLWEVRGKVGKQTIEVPALPPGPILIEARLMEDKSFSVKGDGLNDKFGRCASGTEDGERVLWCRPAEASRSLKVKAKTPWHLQFHGPEAATELVDTVTGAGSDVLAYHGPAADGRLRSLPHPDEYLNAMIDDWLDPFIAFLVPLDEIPPRQDFLDFRATPDRSKDFSLTRPCLIQVSAVDWCEWAVTMDTPAQ